MPDLSGFTGTEQINYLNFLRNVGFTDGWAYLANEVGCFWLADIVASVQHLPQIKENNEFLLWSIVVKDQKAVVTVKTDTGEPNLYKQELNYTDFPEGTFEWYQCGDTVLLKEEY